MNQVEELELKISKFLRFGVIFAGILMFTGWMMQIKWTGNIFFTFEIYDKISLIDMLKIHVHREHWGALVSYAGLASLISLPIIRVFLTALLFVKNKEYLLAGIALIVLAGLTISMFLGIEL